MSIKKKILFISLSLFAASMFAQEIEETEEQELILTETESPSISDENEEIDSSDVIDDSELEDIEVDNDDNDEYYDSYNFVAAPKKTEKQSNGVVSALSTLFSASNRDFVDYDLTELYFLGQFNKLKKDEVDVTYIDNTDYAGVGVHLIGCYYYIFFDTSARRKLLAAGNQYLNDFADKKLSRKDKKSQRKYGKLYTKIYFGSLKSKAVSHSNPITYYGYNFFNDSPYFTITCLQADNEKFKENDVYPKISNQVELCLTKAQLKNLMNLLSDENLAKIQLNKLNLGGADEY